MSYKAKMQPSIAVLVFLTVLVNRINGEIKNCTSAPCNIQTCQNTTANCQQICSATPCTTMCTSPAGCEASCPLGGCSKMTCNVPSSAPRPTCMLKCQKNCQEMHCTSEICYPDCAEDNCKITCITSAPQGQCYPRCNGRNCELNCKAFYCEARCTGGNCTIRFSKISSGSTSCDGGHCKLICAKGKSCDYIRPCSNCTKTVVDDPFAPSSALNAFYTTMHVLFVSLVSAVICIVVL